MSDSADPVEKKPKRRRRSSESARREILDAAGRCLMEEGPDGLRLQTIAADLGIAHSSILHHFGSRDGLLDALSADAFQGLERDLQRSFEAPTAGDPATDLFDKIARVLHEGGHARLLAWQLLSGRGPLEPPADPALETRGAPQPTGLLDRLAQTVHFMRTEQAREQGRPAPELVETRRLVVLTACTVFGDAFAGDLMMGSAGLGVDDAARLGFRHWLAKIIETEVFPPATPDETDRTHAADPEDVQS